ncbi:MAG: ArsR family transcriptional regulator [Candidatus Heimdallarchaeota archaeon]|nr:ArsR family transcriptional regulator [Candidatus Heimdallarchaeota archaeon]
MSKSTQTYNPKDRKILYTFWDSLPEKKIVVDYDEDFFKHFARKITFRLLGEGIREKLPNGEIVTRKALNVQEILQEINELLDKKFKVKEEREKFDLSLHSLYFHLQKLEEVGFIKTIAILKEGRHNVAYYARSAKVVLFKDVFTEDEKIKIAFTSMLKLISSRNPDLDSTLFMEFYYKFNEINKVSLEKIQRKIAEFQDQIYEANIDPNDIQRFFTLINQINPEFVKLFNEIMNYLQLELW